MKKTIDQLKKFTMLILIIAITMAAVPLSTASAARLTADDTPPTNSTSQGIRLSLAWERLQSTYDRQGLRLERADSLINKIQARIDQTNQNGKDTTAIQAALDTFSKAIKDANPIYQGGKGIIASHKGFDANGEVTDRAQALETVRSLGQLIKEVRSLVGDPFILLRDALKAFRDADRPK